MRWYGCSGLSADARSEASGHVDHQRGNGDATWLPRRSLDVAKICKRLHYRFDEAAPTLDKRIAGRRDGSVI